MSDWFSKEADRPITGQDKVRQENRLRMLGGRRAESRSPGRNKETGCKHATLKEGTTAWQRVDKKHGF